jgi:rod shape determining protein RodA
MTLQPSELMKPGIVLVLSWFYSVLPIGETRNWRAIVPAAGLVGFPAAFVMLQPDLGTALAICFGAVVVMFLAGLPLRWFLGAAPPGPLRRPCLLFALHDYQRKRVLVFMDPESDPLGSGYHITQSKIAIGSGGFRQGLWPWLAKPPRLCPRPTPTSCSPRWPRNGACWAASSCWRSLPSCCAGA